MKSQSQITIYALNDVVTQNTAPTNPYKGQLWVDTSKTPPVTMVYNGTKWVEQNGTDTIRTSIKTVEEKQAEFKTSLDGLVSTVSVQEKTIEEIESDLGDVEENITSIQTDVSTLEQTTTQISADVSTKADSEYGSSSSSFGWKLKSTAFELYSNKSTVMKVTSSGLEVKGKIEATSGTLGDLTITGQLTFGGNKEYYINPNFDDGDYYINLPGIKIDDHSGAVFSGSLSSPSGAIGGFALNGGSLYFQKKDFKDETAGVFLGKTGIGLGRGTFWVNPEGELHATMANIEGSLVATSGSFANCSIEDTCDIFGYVNMMGAEQVKFYGTVKTMYYDTWIGGTGTVSEISATPKTGSFKVTSYAYTRPFGMTIVPTDYAANCDDGMIFGIMESYSFRTQNLLSGASFYFKNDGTNVYSETMLRCGDSFILDAIADTANGSHCYWGWGLGDNVMSGDWSMNGKFTFTGVSGTYITQLSYGSSFYECIYGNWYASGSLTFGTSSTGYRVRHDSDQVTFSYGTKECGDIECYTTHVDIQGTWKTNGNNWISSSDRNLKKDISEVDDVYGLIFDKLKPVSFKWKSGTSGRTHIGFIAQDVKEATEEAGLTTTEFGAYVHFDASEKDGEIIPETCGIRYEEITPLNTWEIQKLKKRVKELELKLEELTK